MVREPKWYQYVSVGLEGKGTIHLPNSKYQSDEETYVDQIVIVWGNKDVPQPTRLDPGMFNFPFQFTIPADCPPTYNGCYGKIHYRLYGIVSSQVNQYMIETTLIINYLLDFNLQPHLLLPVERVCVIDVYPMCCFCCKSGEAEITFKMQKTGFCVGQQIQVTFEYRNGGSCPITVCIDVNQKSVYVDRGRRDELKFEYRVKRSSHQIPASGYGTSSVEIDLHSVAPAIAIDTRIFKVTYNVSFMVVESHRMLMENAGMYSIPTPVPPQVIVPITFGNVPF